MKEFWDVRYLEYEFAYGTEPNALFKEFIDPLPPGKILLPAEGEGRHAVYAAEKGWKVTAFDYSEIARSKALKFAKKRKVSFKYTLNDMETYKTKETYDVIAIIFAHLPGDKRKIFHRNMISMLKKNTGKIFLVAFSKKQISNHSGGPKNIDMLYDIESLKEDFKQLEIISLDELVVRLEEGRCHRGKADVIRLIAEGRK
jgi:cyclopropane fatty-acyl-phospholipid synthase-like methyltransferase